MTRLPATRRLRAGWCLLLIAALVGCNSSPSPSPATPEPAATAGASAGPGGTATPAPSQASDVTLPPGAQYARAATSIPGEAEPVVTQFLTRAYFFATRDGHPEAMYRDGSAWDQTVIDDGKGYHPQAGATLDSSFRVAAAAANDTAMVVLGSSTTTDRDRPTGYERLPESVIWSTRDGKTFDRFNPRTIIDDAISIRLTGIALTSAGFVVVGTVFPRGLDGRADVVVLRSADGATWTVASRLDGGGTLHVRRLFADGDLLVLDTTDQLCDKAAVSYPTGLRTGATRAWASPDGGTSWQPLNLTAAEPILQQPAPPAACPSDPKLGDIIAISQETDTEGALVGLQGGALIARSRDGTMVGVSRDFRTWVQVALPDAVPIAADARRPYAQAIVVDTSGAIRTDGTLALLALEDRADLDGRPRSGGCQVRWWRTQDAGATWSTGPWGRPFSTCATAIWSFEQLLDGSVLLFANSIIANTNRGEASFRTGSGGALIPWDTCVPGPKVDCSFATITGLASAAADWSGINLSGSTVTGAAVDGVRMPKANAYAAFLSGSFKGADLGEAVLSYAILEGDFGGADLHDALLLNVTIRADLTGANLDGAELFGVTFGDGAVCPDGQAPAADSADAEAACRR